MDKLLKSAGLLFEVKSLHVEEVMSLGSTDGTRKFGDIFWTIRITGKDLNPNNEGVHEWSTEGDTLELAVADLTDKLDDEFLCRKAAEVIRDVPAREV